MQASNETVKSMQLASIGAAIYIGLSLVLLGTGLLLTESLTTFAKLAYFFSGTVLVVTLYTLLLNIKSDVLNVRDALRPK